MEDKQALSYSGSTGRYTDNLKFLVDMDTKPKTFMLAPAHRLIEACEVLVQCAPLRVKERWPLSKDDRRSLARQMECNLPKVPPPREQWKEVIQHALQIVYQQIPKPQRFVWEKTGYLAELETDIHVSVDCTLQTVRFFYNDRIHLPLNTSVFLVSPDWNEFVSSLIAGDLNPAWVASVDAAKTPECIQGQFPRYIPR
ncbi:TPA: hypothetical protein ACMY33_003679 [Yersinia enterocolitica]|uniref:hypothetical protein n=1 Tax=Yersinia TaxID=629 RepID=UPI00070B57EB|nr:hypothetical protein [Yersinia mollaretii]EKN5075361.1 hypothetical protein [Yersinia enterocolitica]EKN5117739.1 hypothetical protein [Yersinia enterocolitica]EKN5910522.1 hypothetical protein [Yersinia enterocolitica]EKN6374909.1 hypothetical protein [Yersinia enterocolitica]HDL6514498.1 hypothetical protein [Yersinia enterocolitica]